MCSHASKSSICSQRWPALLTHKCFVQQDVVPLERVRVEAMLKVALGHLENQDGLVVRIRLRSEYAKMSFAFFGVTQHEARFAEAQADLPVEIRRAASVDILVELEVGLCVFRAVVARIAAHPADRLLDYDHHLQRTPQQ